VDDLYCEEAIMYTENGIKFFDNGYEEDLVTWSLDNPGLVALIYRDARIGDFCPGFYCQALTVFDNIKVLELGRSLSFDVAAVYGFAGGGCSVYTIDQMMDFLIGKRKR